LRLTTYAPCPAIETPENAGVCCALRWYEFMQGPGRFRGTSGLVLVL
jgi:hypothetical protein